VLLRAESKLWREQCIMGNRHCYPQLAKRQAPGTFRLPFVVKARPQMEQTKGFSPVCVRSWIWRALADEKFFPHAWQLCCFGVRRGGVGPSRLVIPGLLIGG